MLPFHATNKKSACTKHGWQPNPIENWLLLVVEVGAELTGDQTTLCNKIGYSSRDPRRAVLPCIKIGYVSAMYKDMEPTQCIKIWYSSTMY